MLHADENPLLDDWQDSHQFPPFENIKAKHFLPAIEHLAAEHLARIDAIAHAPDAPTFANTVHAFDEVGGRLERIEALFEVLGLTVADAEFRSCQAQVSAHLARHRIQVLRHRPLYDRLDALHRERGALRLADDELRLLEKLHRQYTRSGIGLDGEDGARLTEIKARLAELDVAFAQNLLASTDAFELELHDADELEGLPEFVRQAARVRHAGDAPDRYVFTLKYASVVAFLTHSARRDLREKIWRAWIARGTGSANDNRPIAQEMVTLRLELARLLGYRNYADYVMEDRMARTPAAAQALLRGLWEPARALCEQELAELRALAAGLGEPTDIEPWDWRYLSAKMKQRKFDVDGTVISEYLALDSVIGAAFDCAARLFRLSFHERYDITLYHPDARLWEVRRDGETIGYFIGDYYARQDKNSGAWESELRMQRDDGVRPVLPIVVNSASFVRNAEGPTLLGADEARFVFHEFGHGLHSLLSKVRLYQLSGTRVVRDFVEFPSHLFENWALHPEVLARHALHVVSGEPMPAHLAEKLHRSLVFNEGYELVRYIAPALLDIALHSLEDTQSLDIEAFEAEQFAALGLLREADVNMHLPHFRHIFSEDAYAVGYYGYLWAQMLEADAFDAFEEAGDPFDAQTAERLYRCLLSQGDAQDPQAGFLAFRGRAPDIGPLARKRGVAPAGRQANVASPAAAESL